MGLKKKSTVSEEEMHKQMDEDEDAGDKKASRSSKSSKKAKTTKAHKKGGKKHRESRERITAAEGCPYHSFRGMKDHLVLKDKLRAKDFHKVQKLVDKWFHGKRFTEGGWARGVEKILKEGAQAKRGGLRKDSK